MKKIISLFVSIALVFTLIPNMFVASYAAAKCPKGHTYSEHYCKTCKKYEMDYTGLAKKDSTWYYVKNGKTDNTYTGLAKNDYGWWYVKDGKINYEYVGLAKNDYGWWYVKKGTIDFKYTGMAKNQYGWWYVKNGKLDKSFTGMAKNDYGWWYLKNGTIDFNYTGIAKNDYGNWYLKNGKLDNTYNGTYTDKNGTKWTVTNGKAVKKTSNNTSSKMGTYEVDPVEKKFANPIGSIKKAWILKNPDGRKLSELGLDIRVSRVELNKTVSQDFNKNVSSQIANPKKLTYKPTCSIAVIECKDGDPTHLIVSTNQSNQASTTQALGQASNAIIAINNQAVVSGDFYDTNKAAAIRNGRIYRKYTGNESIRKGMRLIMYKDGTWKFGTLDNTEANKAIADGAWNSFRYQDVTIQDGKITATFPENGIYRNRTFFGQISKTKYVMMVTEYMPIADAAKVLMAYGCKNAIQIMGGNCSQMYVNNVGNTTGMTGASVKNLNKIGFLETEWMANQGLLAANAGGGPCSHEVDILYVR